MKVATNRTVGMNNRASDLSHPSFQRVFHRVRRAIARRQFFHMCSQWTIDCDIDEIADLLLDSSNLPNWWSDCFLRAEILESGDRHANGRVVNLVTRGVLPYNLHFQIEILEVDYPYQFELRSEGNFIGRGIGRLRQAGDKVVVDFDWKIRFAKPILNRFCWILQPFYVANHRWVMQRGQIQAFEAIQSRRAGALPATPTSHRRSARSRRLSDLIAYWRVAKQLLLGPSMDPAAVWAAGQENSGMTSN